MPRESRVVHSEQMLKTNNACTRVLPWCNELVEPTWLGRDERANNSRWAENVLVDGTLKRKECISLKTEIFVQRRTIEVTASGTIEEFTAACVGPDGSLVVIENRPIVLKTFNLQADVLSEQLALKELELHQRMTLTNSGVVLPLLNTARTKSKIFAFLPYVSNGDLFQSIKRNHQSYHHHLNQAQSRCIMYGMLRSVLACHDAGISHRDISPENFLLMDENTPVLIDFGLSVEMEDDWSCLAIRAGKDFYMAPEMFALEEERYDGRKVDIWSLGITFFIMASTDSSPPWHFASKKDIFFASAVRDMPQFLANQFPDNKAFCDLISRMLTYDPIGRPSARELMDHEWFRDVRAG